jgi:hypothetical protein
MEAGPLDLPGETPTSTPLYKVVEIMRDQHGRTCRSGSPWCPSIELTRAFARQTASNTSAYRVQVVANGGAVIEEVPVATR